MLLLKELQMNLMERYGDNYINQILLLSYQTSKFDLSPNHYYFVSF